MAKISPLNIKKILCLSNIFLFSSVFGSTNIAYADVDGIPYNPSFPQAQYPYAKAPNGCGPGIFTDDRREIRDTWGPVDFTGACNTHDKCYYTSGSNWNTCNERFYSDLRAACERDLRVWVPPVKVLGVTITPGFHTPPEPVSLTACYMVATSYYGGVQAGVVFDVFKDAQNLQRDYEQWVASVKNPSSSSASVGNPSIANTPIFDADFYLMSYGDLRNAFGTSQESARNHWLSNGIREGRRSSPAFDVQYYLGEYRDLQNAFGANNYAAAVNHWFSDGIKEGRRSSFIFDVQFYLGKYPDLQNAFGANNYAAAVNHWLSNGVAEGRQGSADFDPKFYLSNNPDVARAFGANNYKGAIEHYLSNGRAEGRRGIP